MYFGTETICQKLLSGKFIYNYAYIYAIKKKKKGNELYRRYHYTLSLE